MWKRDVQRILIFDILETFQRETSKRPRICVFQTHNKTSTLMLRRFFTLRKITSKKHIEYSTSACS